jgi:hypothetical protein
MKESLIDTAIKACQDTLETIKQQQEFNKFLFNTHKCPTCGRIFKDRTNAEYIDQIGECMQCDHVRGELNDQYRGEGPDHTVENWDGETSEDKWFTDAYLEEN